jgi:hypothetical protein
MNGRSDLESLLSETLRAVGDQTVPDRTYSFESIRRDLARPIQSSRRWSRFGPGGYWLAAAVATGLLLAGLSVVKAGGGPFTAATGGGRHDLVSSDGRLYLLPPGDTDLRLGVFSATGSAGPEGSAIVIGRPTQLGFDHLAVVTHRTDPCAPSHPCDPGDSLPFDFSGERYYINRDANNMSGGTRHLPDGSVFDITTSSGQPVEDAVDKATGFFSENQTVSNGQIVFNQPPASSNRYELQQIGQVADISHRQVMELIYPNPSLDNSVLQALANTADTLTLITQASNGGDDELLYLAAQGGATSVERTTVWGTPGYKLLTVPGGTTGLVWHSSTGHVVGLMTSLGEAKTLALAEGLRSVDETTWTAELARINGQ